MSAPVVPLVALAARTRVCRVVAEASAAVEMPASETNSNSVVKTFFIPNSFSCELKM
jgi:hypothetical protein